ncbi:hypothetical protein [Labrys sp. WJW]|uniref:hypothetical protein n=1 Tax=Labrys sp. WJW TaxID=1737983 RepID=UPI0012EA5710|nr:hypothetical protein [Labrys sp. WJW]
MSTQAHMPATIDEAEREGWRWLEASCSAGHNTWIPWRLLRMRTGRQDLAGIIGHGYCTQCQDRRRPDRYALVRETWPTINGPPSYERLAIEPAAPTPARP